MIQVFLHFILESAYCHITDAPYLKQDAQHLANRLEVLPVVGQVRNYYIDSWYRKQGSPDHGTDEDHPSPHLDIPPEPIDEYRQKLDEACAVQCPFLVNDNPKQRLEP